MPDNIYLPQLARVASIKEEVAGERSIKTFRVEPVDGKLFDHEGGQCAMLSIFGRGESMLSIASSPLIREYKHYSIMRMGRMSPAFHERAGGDGVGIRAPSGNSFPVDDWRGTNLLLVGGG